MKQKNEDDPENADVTAENPKLEKPDLKGDWLNFFLLLLLYTMQGIPLGLAKAVPILLQRNKYVTYGDQSFFSITTWPFSLKILWAPLIDAIYIERIGRRMSWLIPVQLLIGTCFLYIANNIEDWMSETEKPHILNLVCVFFITKLLAATQDIIVDSWGLTILQRKNIGYASTCQQSGQFTGEMIGCVLTVLLTSEDFNNQYIRNVPATGGIITMKSIFYIFGILFIFITTLVGIFKREKDTKLEDDHVKLSIFQYYSLLWDILKLPNIRLMATALLTVQVGFVAVDKVSILKLIDAGVATESITIIQTAMFAMRIILPLTIAKYTSGPKPMNIYLRGIAIKLFWNIAYVILIYFTPISTLKKHNGVVDVLIYYYVILIFILSVHDILNTVMCVTLSSFFSRCSDSRFGGTYMTLFYTLSNLGHAWTSPVSLGMIDLLTFKKCSHDPYNKCSTPNLQDNCVIDGGYCVILTNGYYIEVFVCTIFGILWYHIFRTILKNMQTKDRHDWLVNVKRPFKKNDKNERTTADDLNISFS